MASHLKEKINKDRNRRVGSDICYCDLFDLIKSGIAIYKAVNSAEDFIIADINSSVERIESVVKKEVIGRKVTEVFPGVGPFGLLEVMRRVWRTGVPEQFPVKMYKDDRISGWRENYIFKASDGNVVAVYDDLTEIKRLEEERNLNESRLESLFKISRYDKEDVTGFLDFALDEALKLTGSKLGYIYFYDPIKKEFTLNTWSKGVMDQCTIQEKQTVYQLDRTGIWGEAVRQRRPIMVNDFHKENPLKKGYPEGHARLDRFLTIPIIYNNLIEGVIGVANKENPYNESDIRQLTILMNKVWEIKKRKERSETIRHLASFPELNPHIVMEFGPDGSVKYLNPTAKRIFKGDEENLRDMLFPPDLDELYRNLNGVNDLVQEMEFSYDNRTYLAYITKPVGMINFRIYAVNITDKVKLIGELKEREESFRAVFEAANVGKSMTLPTGEINVNRAFCDMLGYSAEELKGRKWQELTPSEDIPQIETIIGPLIKGQKDSARFEKRYIRKDGSYLWADVHAVMRRDTNGRPLHFITTIVDITERKRAEEEIRDLNSFLLSVRNVNQTITWSDDFKELLTQSAMILTETRGYRSITVAYMESMDSPIEHRTYQKDGLTGQKTTEWDRTKVPNCIENVFCTGEPRTFDNHMDSCRDCSFFCEKGDHHHILVPVKEGGGNVIAVILACLDPGREIHREEMNLFLEVAGDLAFAHKKIQVEEELKRSESKNKAMVEGMEESLLMLSQDGEVLHANGRAIQMFGWKDLGKAMEARLTDMFPKETTELIFEHIRDLLRTGNTAEDEMRTVLGGFHRILRLKVTTIPYGPKKGSSILLFIDDITEQSLARERLKGQEEEFRKLIMSTAEGFWRIDRNGLTVEVNDALTSMLGYSKQELLGRSPSSFLVADDVPLYREMSASGGVHENRIYDLRIRRKDKEKVHTRVCAAKLFGPDGRPNGSFALLTDITELRMAYQRLETEKNRSETLLDLLGHDISNIHQGMVLSLEVALSDSFEEKRRKEAMMTVRNLSKRSMNLARNILILSKLTESIPDLGPIDLQSSIMNALKMCKDAFPERSIKFVMEDTDVKVDVIAEPLLDELFFNLFHNSVKFRPEDPAVINISVSPDPDDRKVKICISDNGPGIPKEMWPYVFDRSKTPSRKLMSGIGLSLVKKLTERFKGKIELKGSTGKGVKGVIYELELPMVDQNI